MAWVGRDLPLLGSKTQTSLKSSVGRVLLLVAGRNVGARSAGAREVELWALRSMTQDDAKSLWVDQASRLIRIRDPRIAALDAETLAAALWDRPLVDRPSRSGSRPSASPPEASRRGEIQVGASTSIGPVMVPQR